MKHLAAKYTELKKMIGGNREKVHYEESFGMPIEEFWKVTPPNPSIRRILAEIEFSIRLSQEYQGTYDSYIHQALDLLLTCVQEDGVLTHRSCEEAEKLLLPLSAKAKEYSLILAAHAHIDMNWMWGWNETVAATIATFQTMLKMLREYPDFCFSQSQAAVYKIIDDYAPELKPEIMKYIREGRWEVTASAWVETDKNMPSTESLMQHIYQTKKYLQENWEIEPDSLNIDFSPDTFGHSANLPELDALGGVDYYYHCRGLDGNLALYRWKAPSGKEIIVYREQYWYNSGINPLPGIGLIDVSRRSGGLKTGLVVYGVGDHGGGPTRRDIERALEMMQWPVFPQMHFGTFGEFFKKAETVREKLPLVEKELNFIMPGCYTTQSRLKMANRRTEAALYDAQLWDTFAKGKNVSHSEEKQFDSAWQSVLFTHFHDILTGSCVQDSREHAMGEFAHAAAVAESRSALALQGIAKLIDTSDIVLGENAENQSEGAGVGYGLGNFSGVPSPERGYGLTRLYHLYNSASVEREQPYEITVWDWTGDLREIHFSGPNGETLPFQLLDESLQTYWDHKYFRVLVAAKIPAFGFTTVVMTEKECEEYKIYLQPEERTHKPSENIVLENQFIRAEFCFMTGELISLVDKAVGKEKLLEGKTGGLRYIETEKKSSNAWNIGRYEKISEPLDTLELKRITGSLRSSFEIVQKIKDSHITSTVYLDVNAKAFTVNIKADWHEITKETVPVLVYQLPIESTEKFLYDVPAGAVYREPQHLDLPGLQYAAAVQENRLLAIVSDCKYGYRGTENNLACTLINATYSPDPYPERGVHEIRFSVGVFENNPKAMEENAFLLNHKVHYQSGTVQKGILKKEDSFLQAELGTAVLSGISVQQGEMTVRLFETNGQDTKVQLHSTLLKLNKAVCCDLLGREIADAKSIEVSSEEGISTYLNANECKMIRIPLA